MTKKLNIAIVRKKGIQEVNKTNNNGKTEYGNSKETLKFEEKNILTVRLVGSDPPAFGIYFPFCPIL